MRYSPLAEHAGTRIVQPDGQVSIVAWCVPSTCLALPGPSLNSTFMSLSLIELDNTVVESTKPPIPVSPMCLNNSTLLLLIKGVYS